MRQRLGIAQALVAEPELLILDEPVSSLDPEGRRDLLALIAELREHSTIIFSTHVLSDVERICDRVGILDHGRLVTEGPLDELLARYAVPLYRIDPEPGQAAAVAALAAELRAIAWIDRVTETESGLIVSVTDADRASAELLPLVVAAGRPPRRVRARAAVARGRVPPARRAGRLMPGLGVLLRKELLESWRTYRTAVVGGLFLFVGLSSPLLAKYTPEILKAVGGDQFGTLVIPTPTVTDAVDQLWKNLAQFGAFAAIILAMGAVSAEQDRGTAAFILSKTASRGAFLGAKAASIAVLLGAATILAVAVGWVYTAILFEPPPVAGWVGLAMLAWLSIGAWAAIAFLGSTVTGSTAAAAGIGFMALLILSVVAAVPSVGAYTPGGLAAPAIALATGAPVDVAAVVTPVISTLVLIAVALAVSVWSFRRREL